MKMYCLILDSINLGHALAAVGHGVLSCYLTYSDDPDMKEWLSNSFKKAVCKVNQKEFDKAKEFEKHVLMTESALDGAETALVFCPRPDEEWPKPFKFYKLYK